MRNNRTNRSNLWSERIHAFQESGKSRKDWCRENEISLSTFSYWLRKLQSETTMEEISDTPVFARLPMEQVLASERPVLHAPVMICLPENIRIEVQADCPAGLIAACSTL